MGEARRIAALLLLFAAIWLTNLGRWDLWGPDEPRYAQVAREMMQSGDYMVPHLNGQVYGEKPPLFFWAVAASSWLVDRDGQGPSPLAARLPSAIAGLGILLLTYLLARRIYGPSVALLSALILFSTVQFTGTATDAHLDSTLTLWTTAAMYLFFRGYKEPSGGQRFFYPAYAAMGLGVLTKGPVGILVPLISAGLFLLLSRNLSALRRTKPLKGLILLVAIVLLWLVPAGLSGGEEYFKYLVFTQSAGRAVNSFSHAAPFYYYVDVFLADFLPWTLFLPFACIHYAKRKEARNGIIFPLAWFVATFLFFSIMSGKRSLYLLPLYPPIAIMIAKFCTDYLGMSREEKDGRLALLRIPCCLVFMGLLGVAGLIALKSGGFLELKMVSGRLPPAFYGAGIFSGLIGLGGMILLIKAAPLRYSFSLTVVSAVGVVLFSLIQPYPLLIENYSLKPFSQRVQRRLEQGYHLKAAFPPVAFNYFLNRVPIELVAADRIEEDFNRDARLLVLYKMRNRKRPDNGTQWLRNPSLRILETAIVEDSTYYLVGKTSEPPP
jgi:4-amino-4-deoxy-L-arabinose transferase-like glycosyltransferase